MAYEKRTWVSGVTKCSAENFNHMEDGIAAAQNGVDELNTKKVSMSYKNENLTCTAGVIREYVFQGIPTHRISFPVLTGASTNINGCIVYRDTNVTGKIRVYSPINQDVSVMLIILI